MQEKYSLIVECDEISAVQQFLLNKQYKTDDRLEVTIEKIVPRGLGLAFAKELTVFIPLAAVGDKLEVRLTEIKGKTAFAEIESVISPSADRVDPPCPYFGSCGGCDFQQMNYSSQIDAKVAMIRDCLHRIAKIEYENEIRVIASPAEFSYRMRAQWHVGSEEKQIGYYRRNSRDLVAIDRCLVLVPELQTKLDELRESLSWHSFLNDRAQIDVVCGDNGQISTFTPELAESPGDVSFAAAGEHFTFSARSFFQGNRFLIDKLIETAIGDASGETALDLYCGVGLFTIPIARRFLFVTGVEDNADAVEYAKRNAVNAGLTNTKFQRKNVRKFLAETTIDRPDFVLLDPPRFGTEKDTIMNLIGMSPKHVAYVACEPSILARDLRRFAENNYSIDSITAIDLFPQTHHVETVVHFVMN